MFETFQTHYIDLVNDDNVLYNWQLFQGDDDAKDVRHFIVNTQSFGTRVKGVFDRLFPVISGGNNGGDADRVFDACLRQFRQTTSFSVSALTEMMKELTSGGNDDAPSSPEEEQEQKAGETAIRPVDAARDGAFVSAYESFMKRPMYAHELLVVYPAAESDVEAAVKHVRSMYDIVADLVMKYEHRHVSEHDFSREFLRDVFGRTGADVTRDLVARLTSSPVYVDAMTLRIRNRLRSMTGSDPSADDVAFSFQAVGKMHLLDDSIDQLLAHLLETKLEQQQLISKVYDDTYGRAPDATELGHWVGRFRQNGQDVQHSCETLRRELCGDLEYHDVLRNAIEAKLEPDHHSPRHVYGIMKALLRNVAPLWDTERVNEFIDSKVADVLAGRHVVQ